MLPNFKKEQAQTRLQPKLCKPTGSAKSYSSASKHIAELTGHSVCLKRRIKGLYSINSHRQKQIFLWLARRIEAIIWAGLKSIWFCFIARWNWQQNVDVNRKNAPV